MRLSNAFGSFRTSWICSPLSALICAISASSAAASASPSGLSRYARTECRARIASRRSIGTAPLFLYCKMKSEGCQEKSGIGIRKPGIGGRAA